MKEISKYQTEPVKPQQTSLKICGSDINWSLCTAAEFRGENALKQNLFVVVNEFLVVKLIGKMSGIAIDNALSEDGEIFRRGFWYSPLDGEVRESIRRNFIAGITKQDLTNTNWLEIRQVTDEKLLNSAAKAAKAASIITKHHLNRTQLIKKLAHLKESYNEPGSNNEPSA